MRVSLAEAARTLGLSERTIRRRLAAGQLDGIQMQSDTGPRWLIELPERPETVAIATVQPDMPAPNAEAVAAILGELRGIHEALDGLRAELRQQETPALLPGPSWWRRLFSRTRSS